MTIDERLIGALHVETLRRGDLSAEDHHEHAVFQTSTIAALLEGAYDGDVTFRELSERGDLGLGTLNACDGEMIALDGEFLRAAVDGTVTRIDPDERTPFAVMTFFEAAASAPVEAPLDHAGLVELMESHVSAELACHAVRLEGHFDYVRTRSVPRQSKPYPPLVEVVKEQQVSELHDVEGTVVGFRFPDYAEGVNVPGYHLHFVTADRSRGGHVLECRPRRGTLAVDRTPELHVELPPGVEMGAEASPGGDADDAVRRVEHGE